MSRTYLPTQDFILGNTNLKKMFSVVQNLQQYNVCLKAILVLPTYQFRLGDCEI